MLAKCHRPGQCAVPLKAPELQRGLPDGRLDERRSEKRHSSRKRGIVAAPELEATREELGQPGHH